MFDRTNDADLAALQSEESVDPISMGYTAVSGDTASTLDLFNKPSLNVGGETAGAPFSQLLALEVIKPLDLGSLGVGEVDWLNMLFGTAVGGDLSDIEIRYRGIFNGTDTITNLNNKIQALSRTEVLFGQGTVILRDDWLAARDYTA